MHRSDPSNMGLFPTKKTELTPIEKTPNPGILRALFSVSLQNGLRLCENDPLFDRKLLEYLYEQGSGSHQIKPVSGQLLLIQKMIYLESISGSDCIFPDPVFGFF